MLGQPVLRRGSTVSRRNLLTSCLMFSVLSLVAVNFDASARSTPPPPAAPVVPASVTASAVASIPETPVVHASLVSSDESAVFRNDGPLHFAIALLEEANRRLQRINDYTALFIKQERVNGELSEMNRIRMKIRHEPFSVYMNWAHPDCGREVIYVAGRNDGRLVAHEGGFAGLLIPVLRLDPTGSLAMKKSRHPITEAGVRYLAARLLRDRCNEVGDSRVEVTMQEELGPEDRPCWQFQTRRTEYDGTEYGKAVFYVDKERGIPVQCDTYDWPASPDQEPQLLEHYRYEDLQFNQGLDELDFDVANPDYNFKRL